MSGCKARVGPPNGWGDEQCGADTIVGDLCPPHLMQLREDALMREYMAKRPLEERMLDEARPWRLTPGAV